LAFCRIVRGDLTNAKKRFYIHFCNFLTDIIDMKKKYIILTILIVSAILPCQIFAQSNDVFRQDGIASWYGREFEGRPTASGEIFDSSLLTAAHPSLPFGTRLVVTNQHNNKSVTVRVNDRGPFVPARIIDISRAAAEQLDMIVTGTAPVSVVSLDRIVVSNLTAGTQITAPVVTAPVVNTPVIVQPAAPVVYAPSAPVQSAPVVITPAPALQPYAQPAPVYTGQPVVVVQTPPQINVPPTIIVSSEKSYRLQVGSFKVTKNAVDAFDKLKKAGLNPSYERHTDSNGGEYFRVVVAGVRGNDMDTAYEKVVSAGFYGTIIKEEN